MAAARVARFAFRFETLPDIDTTIFVLSAASGSSLVYRYRTASQSMIPAVGITTTGATAVAIVAGRWYVVDAVGSYTLNPVGTMQAQILDTVTGTPTSHGTATGTVAVGVIAAIRIGISGQGETPVGDLLMDDFATGTVTGDYPYGDGQVVGLQPNADGTHSFNAATDFEYDDTVQIATSATDTWTYIDHDLGVIGGGFLAITGAAAGEYLEWQFADLPAVASINGMEVVSSHHAAGTGANKTTLRLVDGGSVSDVCTDADFSNTTITFNSKQYTTAPSGGAWTEAKVNALLLRFGSSWTTVDISAIPYLDAVMFEVDYVPSAAGNTAAPTFRVSGFIG